ncbi:hypothetical protein BYT27DRAFT_6654801 [Phlegmacium glaucopus]|nr:hypothetical protein BYT27DRAFT_6654801 [Phlegmacium glaucopus]
MEGLHPDRHFCADRRIGQKAAGVNIIIYAYDRFIHGSSYDVHTPFSSIIFNIHLFTTFIFISSLTYFVYSALSLPQLPARLPSQNLESTNFFGWTACPAIVILTSVYFTHILYIYLNRDFTLSRQRCVPHTILFPTSRSV